MRNLRGLSEMLYVKQLVKWLTHKKHLVTVCYYLCFFLIEYSTNFLPPPVLPDPLANILDQLTSPSQTISGI